MKNLKILSKYTYVIFLLLLVNAILLEFFLKWAEQHWRIMGMNTFNFIVTIYSPLIIIVFFVIAIKEKLFENKIILLAIMVYALYQVFVILPLTFINYSGHVGVKFISQLSQRLSLLQILLFYWFLLSSFNNEKLIRWFEITSVLMLIFGIYNFYSGKYALTNTGEIRIITGPASIYFTITTFNHLKFLGAKKNNLIIVFLMMLGFTLTVHRSVYVTVILVFLIYILIRYQGVSKFRNFLRVSIFLIIIISSLLLIPGVSDVAISRAQNILTFDDYNYVDRAMKNLYAYEMFLKYPINGTYLTGYYYDIVVVPEAYFWQPHNFIFEILPTQGIVGLSFIFLIFTLIFRLAWKNLNDRLTELSFFVLIYYFLISLSNATFFYNSCTVVLTFFSAMILWRNKVLRTTASVLDSTVNNK